MATLKVRCSLSYHYLRLDTVDVFATEVRDGIYNNALTFPSPPISISSYQTLIDTYINTRAAYQLGGRGNKGPFQAAKSALMAGMDELSAYVNTIAQGDENIILISGFFPTKSNTTPLNPPAVPGVPKVTRGGSGVLIAEVDKVTGADFYGCVVTVNTPKPENININAAGQIVGEDEGGNPAAVTTSASINMILDFNKSRKKTFTGLPLRTNFYFYFYCGNARGVSQFSTGTMMVSS